jgi:hypothetical protein
LPGLFNLEKFLTFGGEHLPPPARDGLFEVEHIFHN